MRINNFDVATKELQSHLEEYLQSKGINTERNFKCLNPNHSDTKPSMSLIKPEKIRAHCFSCGTTSDLFDAVAWLDKLPLTGQGFITETLPKLAEMFDVKLEHTELTEDEQYELDTYRAYRHTFDYLTSWDADKLPNDVKAEIEKRQWKADKALQEAGVGFVQDFNDYRNHMKSIGFSAGFLDDIDLSRKDIFSDGHLIFTIKDESGRPVGFAARDLDWTKGGNSPKYVNQKTTGVKCNIYQKGKRLYGLDVALASKEKGPLYVMEGYSDVLSCHLNGFPRAVATCGTALTDDHLHLLREQGILEVVLCLDNDKPGQDKTEVLLDTKFSQHKDIQVSVLTVTDGKDPDEFIRENGIQTFKNLKPISAFKWRLDRFDESIEPDVICKKMLPFIISESSHISQASMLRELASFTGFSLKTLEAELNRLVNEKERDADRERRAILDKMAKDIQTKPTEAELILNEAQSKLYTLKTKYDVDSFSEDATLKFITDLKKSQEEHNGKSLGFKLGDDLAEFEEAVRGEWKDTLMIVGGSANAGKSSWLCKLAYSIAHYVKENNACVIYHTIDDSAQQLLPKFICIAEGTTKLEINHVQNPAFYNKEDSIESTVSMRREDGYNNFIKLVRDGRLVIKDANDGMSLGYAESLIKYYQTKYPDRQVVYILDNFHKLRDFEGLSDERTKFKHMSQTVKNMAVKFHIPILCTMEYTKLAPSEKPSNNNIAESVQMEYDANLIAHFWNGAHALGDKATADMFHTVMGPYGPERRPILEMNIGKNKITSFKSKIYYKFFPAASDFRAHPIEIVQAAQQSVADEKKKTAVRGSQSRPLWKE